MLQDEYVGLRQEHVSLQNDTSNLETYYNDVQDKYSRLKNEYADLQSLYLNLQRDMMELQNELDDILSLKKEIMLEKSKILEILPEESVTLFYDAVFGYIDVNFTSSGEIYFWIGSSLIEEKYYSRYPPFPDTIFDGAFTVPVSDEIFIYIYNPNSETVANIKLTIKLTY
jgi:predicted nuclease with TOPRIM domain